LRPSWLTFPTSRRPKRSGEDREEALLRAPDAIESALMCYIDLRREIPVPQFVIRVVPGTVVLGALGPRKFSEVHQLNIPAIRRSPERKLPEWPRLRAGGWQR
jgi:hypothetical protein